MALRPENPQSGNEKFAQQKAAQQDVFLREVDDALREDELRTVLQRWGKLIGGVVVAGLLALAGYLVWQQRSHGSAADDSEQLTIALDNVEAGQLAPAASKLAAVSKDGGDAAAAAARILQGGIAAEQGKAAEALKLFEGVAADGGVPQPYRDLATIRAVALNFDALKPEDVVTRLKPLAEPGKPWFASAGELVAMAYVKQGKNNLAGPLFAAISRDKQSPDTLRARARQMAGVLGVDAVEEVDGVATSTGVGPAAN